MIGKYVVVINDDGEEVFSGVVTGESEPSRLYRVTRGEESYIFKEEWLKEVSDDKE